MFGKSKVRSVNISSLDKLKDPKNSKDRKESFTVKSSKDKERRTEVNYEVTECSMINNVNNDNDVSNVNKEGKEDLSERISIEDLRVDTEHLENIKGEKFKFNDNYNENEYKEVEGSTHTRVSVIKHKSTNFVKDIFENPPKFKQ